MPQFLQASFDMLRDSQSQMVENMSAMNPMSQIPGFDAMKAQQEAFLKAMTGGLPGGLASGLAGGWGGSTTAPETETAKDDEGEDLDAIKRQLSELQEKLSKLK